MANEDRAMKIRKLLDKAESTAFEAEREAFTAKAYNLMAEWAIDEAEVRRTRKDAANFEDSFVVLGKTYYKEDMRLVSAIARNLGVFAIADKGFYGGEYQDVAIIHGYAYALEQVKILFTSLLIQRTRSLNDYMKGRKGSASQKYNLRRSFMGGYAAIIEDRLAAQLREASTGTLLPALRSDYERAKESYMKILANTGIEVRKIRSSYGAGYGDGMNAAASADINQPRFASRNDSRALNAG